MKPRPTAPRNRASQRAHQTEPRVTEPPNGDRQATVPCRLGAPERGHPIHSPGASREGRPGPPFHGGPRPAPRSRGAAADANCRRSTATLSRPPIAFVPPACRGPARGRSPQRPNPLQTHYMLIPHRASSGAADRPAVKLAPELLSTPAAAGPARARKKWSRSIRTDAVSCGRRDPRQLARPARRRVHARARARIRCHPASRARCDTGAAEPATLLDRPRERSAVQRSWPLPASGAAAPRAEGSTTPPLLPDPWAMRLGDPPRTMP